MPSAKLSVQLEALLGSSWGNLSKAAQQIQDFEAKAQRAGTTLSAAFTLPIALLGRTSIKSGAELDGLNRSMIAITGSAEEAGKQTKKLNEIAKLPGLNFKDAVQGFVNLRSAGLSAEIAERSLSSFGNALGILGKTGGLGNVNAQIQQMATKTQGFGADLKILKEWVPQVSVALQSAFGTTNADMIEKMGNTGKDVVTKLIAELEKLPKATGGIGNALENVDDAWFKFTGRIGLAIDKAVDLSGIFNKVSDTLNDLATWFENLDPGVQKLILGFTGAVAIAGPLMLALGSMPMLLGAVATGATLLGGVFATVFGSISLPVIAAAVAIGLAFSAIRDYWGETKTALVDKAFFDDLKGLFSGALNFIANIFGGFKNLLTGNWSGLWNNMKNIVILAVQPIINVVGQMFASIQQGLGQLIESAGGKTWGKDMQKNAQQLFKDIDLINADIKKRTTTTPTPTPTIIKRKTQYEIDNEKPEGITPPKGDKGEEKKDYWKEYLSETALNKIKDAHDKLAKEDEAFFKKREDLATNHQNFFKNINLVPQDLIGKATAGYDFLGTKTDAFFDRMKKSMADFSKNLPAPKELPFVEELRKTKEGLDNIMTSGAVDIVTGMAEWAGAFAVGAKSFQDLGNLMKGVFGDLMMTTGKYMITHSTAIKAFKESLAGLGIGGIAIGIGLVAAGSALKASSNKSSGASYQHVPQNSESNYQPIYQPTNTGSNGSAGGRVSIEIPQNSVSNYQPIYQPTNTGSNGSAGGRVSIEITQNKSVLRGNDLVYLEQKTQYGESRGFGVTKG